MPSWRLGLAGLLASSLVGCEFDPAGLPSGAPADARVEVDAPVGGPDGRRVDGGEVIADASIDAGDDNDCPVGYVAELDGTFYRQVSVTATWLTAEADCEDDGEDVHLVVIDDQTELDHVGSLLAATMWVGISDLTTEGIFRKVTGGDPAFLPWAPFEPNNLLGEDCVEMATDKKYNDENCNDTNAYVCECDGRKADPDEYTPED